MACTGQVEPASAPTQNAEASGTRVVPASGPNTERTPGAAVSNPGAHRQRRPTQELGLFGVRAADGVSLTADELLDELSRAEVVCVGEAPPTPFHREAELTMVHALLERSRASGRELGVGLSMLPLDKQRYLGAFAAGRLHLGDFEEASHWADTSDHPFRYYGPLLAVARREGAALIALNTRQDLAEKVQAVGLHGLSPEDRRRLPEIHPANFAPSLDREEDDLDPQAASSAVRDSRNIRDTELVSEESIAERAASWLAERRPLRQLIILADIQLCQESALPGRIRHRLVDSMVVSTLPVLVDGVETPTVMNGYDYAFVLTPDPTLTESRESDRQGG